VPRDAGDILKGRIGDDILVGGAGTDEMTGGGADTFRFTAASESAAGVGWDFVTDFIHVEGDKIDLPRSTPTPGWGLSATRPSPSSAPRPSTMSRASCDSQAASWPATPTATAGRISRSSSAPTAPWWRTTSCSDRPSGPAGRAVFITARPFS